uniref:ANK_REP_REGION domain-containing protein n=1 Tax=Macrostomum lignano TaxID=282301 RepID=A0A1I8JJD2_9PLAT
MTLLGLYDGILNKLLSTCAIARNAEQPLPQTAGDSPLLKFCLEETEKSSCQLIILRAEAAHQVDAGSELCWTSPHHQVAMRVSRPIKDLAMDSGNQQTQLILYDLCQFAFKNLKELQKPELKILTNEKLIMSLFDFKRQPDHQRVENFLVSAYLFMHLIRVPGDRLITVFEEADNRLSIQIGDGPRSSLRKLTFDCSTKTEESFEKQFHETLSEGGSSLYICLFFNELKTCSWYLNEKGKDKQHDRLPNHDTSLIQFEGDCSKLNISVTAFDSVEDKYSSFQMELSADAAFSPDRFGDDELLSTVVGLVRKVVMEQKPANLCLVCLTVPCRTAIKWLDIASGREISCCTEEGQTVPCSDDAQLSIFHSAASGDVALLRQRLEGNRLLVSAQQQEFPRRTALLCAAAAAPEDFSQGQQSHTECASLLINKGADVGDCDSRGHSVLHCAVLSENEELVEFLLKNSTADPNSRDEDGLTPLQLAVEQENVAMADLFLESGVDVCLNPDGTIVELVQALDSENFELVRTLLDHYPEAMSDDQFHKYYWQAWKLDATQIYSLLLISKYGLSDEAVQEATLLGQLASQGDVEQLKLKLSIHNCNLRDWDCRTPLMWSAIASCDPTEGHADCAQLLLSLRANPNAADLDGNSPLHLAAASNNVEVAALLLLHGADEKARNRKGATPAEVAKQSGQPDVQLFLETAEELER